MELWIGRGIVAFVALWIICGLVAVACYDEKGNPVHGWRSWAGVALNLLTLSAGRLPPRTIAVPESKRTEPRSTAGLFELAQAQLNSIIGIRV